MEEKDRKRKWKESEGKLLYSPCTTQLNTYTRSRKRPKGMNKEVQKVIKSKREVPSRSKTTGGGGGWERLQSKSKSKSMVAKEMMMKEGKLPRSDNVLG